MCRAVNADVARAIKFGKLKFIRPFALLQGSNGRAVTRDVTSQLQVWADTGLDAHIDAERLKVLLGTLPLLALCLLQPGQARRHCSACMSARCGWSRDFVYISDSADPLQVYQIMGGQLHDVIPSLPDLPWRAALGMHLWCAAHLCCSRVLARAIAPMHTWFA